MRRRPRGYLRSIEYWVLFFIVICLAMLVGVAVSVEAGINPFVGASITGGLLVLYETYQVARHPR